MIEEFYDDTENLERNSRERYISGRKKHHRRCANEIKRQLQCPYPSCNKLYGSEGSLNLHIKIKHNDEIKMNLNLPPGSLEKAASMLNVPIDPASLNKLEKNVLKCNEETEKQRKKEIMKTKDKNVVSKSIKHSKDESEDND